MRNLLCALPVALAGIGGAGDATTINMVSGEFAVVSDQTTIDGPSSIAAGGRLTNTNEPLINESTLTVDGILVTVSDAELINDGTINNNGIVGGGTLTNNGILTSSFGAELTTGVELNNYGTLSNSGRLFNGGTLKNYGDLNNNDVGSTLPNTFTLRSYGTLVNYGNLTNNDVFENYVGGNLINASGATLTNNGTLYNGPSSELSNSGTLVNNGTLINSGGTFEITDGSVLWGNGTFSQSDGRFSNGDGTITETEGTLTVNGNMEQSLVSINGGSLAGSGTITSPVMVNNATVSAGAFPLTVGTLNVVGDIDVRGTSTLLFELAGFSSFDTIEVLGTATIADGTMFDVDFLGGYTPTRGSIFDVLVADTIVADLTTFDFDFSGVSGISWTTSLFAFGDGSQSIRITAGLLPGCGPSGGRPPKCNPEISTVPLPAGLPLLLLGLGSLSFVGLRKTKVS